MALPSARHRRPAETVQFEQTARGPGRLAGKENLQAIVFGIFDNPHAIGARGFLGLARGVALQFGDARLDAADIGAVVGQLLGGVTDAADIVRLEQLAGDRR